LVFIFAMWVVGLNFRDKSSKTSFKMHMHGMYVCIVNAFGPAHNMLMLRRVDYSHGFLRYPPTFEL
jgi:hypothetical protein